LIVYAESSAVLAWLLGESSASIVQSALARAERVVTSALTVLECERALRRAELERRITGPMADRARQALRAVLPGWVIMEMTGPHLTRVGDRFPIEPVRTLDAMHLAAAMEFGSAVPGLALLSLDDRIRSNAAALGLLVAPD
jgi:predicted nucleic acid-binding protein